MTGRPDYNAGDLVVCVCDKHPEYGFQVGRNYRALKVGQTSYGAWYVEIEGKPVNGAFAAGWNAEAFRRIDPKPPEFWTGTVDADANEKVPA